MGRTYRRNDRFKKDRRDKNFRKSKKFKDFQHPKHESSPPIVEETPEPEYGDATTNNNNV